MQFKCKKCKNIFDKGHPDIQLQIIKIEKKEMGWSEIICPECGAKPLFVKGNRRIYRQQLANSRTAAQIRCGKCLNYCMCGIYGISIIIVIIISIFVFA